MGLLSNVFGRNKNKDHKDKKKPEATPQKKSSKKSDNKKGEEKQLHSHMILSEGHRQESEGGILEENQKKSGGSFD